MKKKQYTIRKRYIAPKAMPIEVSLYRSLLIGSGEPVVIDTDEEGDQDFAE